MTTTPAAEARGYRGAPMRTFRMDNEGWARVQAEAARQGVSASEVLRTLADTLSA